MSVSSNIYIYEQLMLLPVILVITETEGRVENVFYRLLHRQMETKTLQ
jgi:hypothetical protein